MNDEQSAVEWMRRQAKVIAPDIVSGNESTLLCSRIISGRIKELEAFVKDVAASNSGNIFLLRQANKLLK